MRRRAGGPGRHSIGRRGGAPGGAGPYVTGAAHPGRRARWLARDARAGPFAKDLPREPRKLPWGLANPGRLPALHPLVSRDGKRDTGAPAPQKIGPAELWSFIKNNLTAKSAWNDALCQHTNGIRIRFSSS